MESSWAVLALAGLVTLGFISKVILKHRHPKRRSPPGPIPWPVIGNLNLIGPTTHISLHALSQKYGEIMRLKFGKFPVVVASSPEMAKQFLKTHDRVFASRPAGLAAGKYIGYNYSNMSWAPYGPYLRQARKIYLTEVFSTRALEFYEHTRTEERRKLFSRLNALSGGKVVMREHLSRYTLTMISRMVFSNRYFGESDGEKSIMKLEEFQGMIDEWFSLNRAFNIGDWVPGLGCFDLQGYVKKMKALRKRFDDFFNHVIDDHRARRAANKDDFVPKDVLDSLLHLADDPNLEVELTSDCIKGLLHDLLVGGTDTSTIEGAMLALIKQPHIMEKAKEELDRVIGRSRWVEEKDASQLPYINAIITETLRLHSNATFLGPHFATENCNVAGYDISKGTIVLINTWSIGRDPNTWDAAEEFVPDRFLGKEVDVLGNNFALLPFGAGRRMCPGYNLGFRINRTTLANLLHGFNWKLHEGMMPEHASTLALVMEPTLSIPF